MKCKYCDYQVPENAHLCANCGRILAEKKEKKPVKKRSYIIFIIIAVAVIFICGMLAMNFQSSMNGNHSTHPSNDLGISYIQFKNQFNDNDYAEKINLSIGTVEKKTGSEDTYHYALSDKLLLIEKVNSQSNHLRQITLIGQPSSIQEDNVKLIGAMGIIIDTFSSDLSINDRKEILRDLGFNETVKDLKSINAETIRGNIKYGFKYKENLGFIFSVSNKNDMI
ncbi:hypothetical protein [Anaerosinus gibii]|uniref:Zinc ribbon domain-containing protein n=1 Tax=Selenobaculum gibii TaxID=3054208 RepID=A0A9Y2ES30_9FIRM|nr:hypothetical protein [Selenobaculum gbiensis]WIW71867.1 hypothetical protein P3F81_06120 [Selenobaculum gbiensis]